MHCSISTTLSIIQIFFYDWFNSEYTFMSICALVKTCYGLAYCLSQKMFCVHLIRVFFHLSLGKVFDKCVRSSWLSQGFVTQSCSTLCGLMDCSPPGSTVHGFPKEEHWSGFFPWSGHFPLQGILKTQRQNLGLLHCRLILYWLSHQRPIVFVQSCLTLCDPVDCSPPGSSVHGILQARTLEWIAISFSRELFYRVIQIFCFLFFYCLVILSIV